MLRGYLFILTILSVLAAAPAALAMRASLDSVAGEAIDSANPPPINRAQCDANVDIKFTVTNDMSSKYLFVMVKGTNCDQERTADNNSCTTIYEETIEGAAETQITIKAQDLDIDCGTSSSEVTVYFLGHENDASELSATGDVATYKMEVDTVTPPVPTNVKGGEGEHSIPISWDFESQDVEEFWIYYEVVTRCPEGSALCPWSQQCASSHDLTGPEDGGAAGEPTVEYDTAPANVQSFNLRDKVGVGETAAVAVFAVDAAGNSSLASNVVCVTGVATVGFCELNENSGGKCESGCSAGPLPAARASLLPAACLVLLALAWVRRRR